MKPLRSSNADSVNLSVKVKEWDKDVTYDLVYRYDEISLNARTEMPIPVISSDEYYKNIKPQKQ